jgi:hypothetical protein
MEEAIRQNKNEGNNSLTKQEAIRHICHIDTYLSHRTTMPALNS